MLGVKIEERINLKFFVKLNKTARESFQTLTKVYGKECMSRARVFEWHKRFRKDWADFKDDEGSRRPSTPKNH